MAQPTIILRGTKGTALTWQEGDANFTNLAAAALPTGGTTGQVLVKNSDTDYDFAFAAPSSGAQGIQGIQGATGEAGSQGTQGIQGITGTGTQGIQGTIGSQGTQGIQGVTGSGGVTINDSATTSTTETWSANKLYTTLGDIAAALAAINGEA